MAATAPSLPDPLISWCTTATNLHVRDLVESLASHLDEAGIDRDLRGSIALAVSEALNNITEHAYADRAPGPVTMTVDLLPDRVDVTLIDSGRAIPGQDLPPAHLPDSAGPRSNLPEGGFGWFLIHSLCRDLTYTRTSGQNTLSLRFPR
ncbi:ATP-binding protein [Roseovarius atlanticus]|uniref:ATP-binding protein n=1 Tax=Roseovarius atlanticus TaxID=1641875 RepID=UPI001C952B9E|nr:ATP-binding protein [Roseovarius atlanticus]MBY5986713.1 ATP-binding protein [Roseovarius atlanticus]MBY6125353.1 ATP-binding protein [Roseovarius atlanticus]MBY6150186.1 ATP-binding protein [Roseovarius atlanticus]